MRILVLGATGMMGHMACRVLAADHDVFGATRARPDPDAALARFLPTERWIGDVDVHRWDTVVAAMERVKPTVVLNCVGLVKQLAEAEDPIACIEVNALLPHRLALLAELMGAKFVHLSTDCVFSGRRGNYKDDDVPDPMDLYGRSKLLGETTNGTALTLRTSIIGRQLSGSTGLLEWFLSQRGGHIRGYARALYTGLTTRALSHVIGRVLNEHSSLSGVWQVASSAINKYDLLERLNRAMELNVTIDKDEDFSCDRRLDGSRFAGHTGISAPTWDEMVADIKEDDVNYS